MFLSSLSTEIIFENEKELNVYRKSIQLSRIFKDFKDINIFDSKFWIMRYDEV